LATVSKDHDRVRFGGFEFDCRTGELRSHGQLLRLEPQPAKVLTVLIRNAGEVVTRQDLIREVWGTETFVDFEQGLNYAIRRIRIALEDDAEHPQFLETLPKKGHRFTAQIDRDEEADRDPVAQVPEPKVPQDRRVKPRVVLLYCLAALIFVSGFLAAWKFLHRAAPMRSGDRLTSLAVLPLRNLSADPEQEYFSDGMTDELTTDLAKMSGIRIISHTSVERYKKSTAPVTEIARELHVDAVVEGSVTRMGNRVRITAQLIDARTDTHLWAESYERDLPATLALQDTLARDIAQEIRGKVLPKGKTDRNTAGEVPAAALDSYLRGRYLWNRRDPDSVAKAEGYFEQAIRVSPDFASAYSGLADCFGVGWGPVDLPASEKYARKAISLDPELAEGHASLGITLLLKHRFREAEPELHRAIELNPNYAMAHHYYSAFLLTVGRPKDALAENDQARQLDPFGIAVNTMRTVILIDSNELEGALVQAGHLAEIAPQTPSPYELMARVFWRMGRVPEAIEAEKREGAARHMDQWIRDQDEIGRIYARNGLLAARRRAAELMERHQDILSAAYQYGNLQNPEKVIEKLEAIAWKQDDVQLQIRTAPEFQFMHGDPRYLDLVHRLQSEP
jgi:TolB-like protein/DNA-binding winged helix-turn-helix (wHTH) protein/Tfp pilus assembly protein PilF